MCYLGLGVYKLIKQHSTRHLRAKNYGTNKHSAVPTLHSVFSANTGLPRCNTVKVTIKPVSKKVALNTKFNKNLGKVVFCVMCIIPLYRDTQHLTYSGSTEIGLQYLKQYGNPLKSHEQ